MWRELIINGAFAICFLLSISVIAVFFNPGRRSRGF
jgi:hypothetical protein